MSGKYTLLVALVLVPLITSLSANFATSATLDAKLETYLSESDVPRKALVVGMKTYKTLNSVPSAKTDAERVGEQLTNLDFNVTYSIDDDFETVYKKIRSFDASLDNGDIAVFYFSGHGFQWEGLNYLVPIDAPTTISATQLPTRNIPLDDIIYRLNIANAGYSLLIVDACRENNLNVVTPSGEQKNVGKNGLHQIDTPPELIIGFATYFGSTAFSSSNSNENSIYTKHLVKQIGTPGKDIAGILSQVAIKVFLERKDQKPETRSIVAGSFYPRPDPSAHALEKQAWSLALRSGDSQTVQEFLLNWPVGKYARSARKYLSETKRGVGDMGTEGNLAAVELETMKNEGALVVSIRGNTLTFPMLMREVSNAAGSSELNAVGYTKEKVDVLEKPDAKARRVASLASGQRVRVLDSRSAVAAGKTTAELDQPNWTKVSVEDLGFKGQVGYLKDALGVERRPLSESTIFVMRLKQARKIDLTRGKALVISVDEFPIRPGVIGNRKKEVPLERFMEAIPRKKGTSARKLDFSRLLAIVSVQPFIEGSRSPQETRQLVFLRALQIRNDLVSAGIRDQNVLVKLPENYVLDKPNKLKFDTVHIYLP